MKELNFANIYNPKFVETNNYKNSHGVNDLRSCLQIG